MACCGCGTANSGLLLGKQVIAVVTITTLQQRLWTTVQNIFALGERLFS